MDAEFKLEGLHRPVIVLKPDYGVEAVLMAAFIGFDSNIFTVSVERSEGGSIKSVTLIASDSR